MYKVVHGHKPGQFWRIESDELEKFLYAQRYEKVVASKGKQINGRNIIRIEEDWHYYTGWNVGYEPTDADDFKQIKRDAPSESLKERMSLAQRRVSYAVENKQVGLLKEPEKIDNLLEGPKGVSEHSKELSDKLRLSKGKI